MFATSKQSSKIELSKSEDFLSVRVSLVNSISLISAGAESFEYER